MGSVKMSSGIPLRAAVVDIKKSAIKDFQSLLDSASKGYYLDYQPILEKIIIIDLVESGEEVSPFLLAYYNNTTWEYKQY